MTTPVTIAVDGSQNVSGLFVAPANARACYVLAHGAGAGMTHPFMDAVAKGAAQRDIATLRYQFPYMEHGSKRPDPPKVAQAAVRAAVAQAARLAPGIPLIAGGKSFGGRMSSQAQSAAPMPGVSGLLFFGFPLHPTAKPSIERAQHLAAIRVPMLFVQGTRDEMADVSLIESTVGALGRHARLHWIQDGDHSLKVPARSQRSQAEVFEGMFDAIARWIENLDETA